MDELLGVMTAVVVVVVAAAVIAAEDDEGSCGGGGGGDGGGGGGCKWTVGFSGNPAVVRKGAWQKISRNKSRKGKGLFLKRENLFKIMNPNMRKEKI